MNEGTEKVKILFKFCTYNSKQKIDLGCDYYHHPLIAMRLNGNCLNDYRGY